MADQIKYIGLESLGSFKTKHNEEIDEKLSEHNSSTDSHADIRNVIGSLNVVPDYSTSNEGQFLRIVNGVPMWTTIINAEEVSF